MSYETIYLTIALCFIIGAVIAYMLFKKNIHFPFI